MKLKIISHIITYYILLSTTIAFGQGNILSNSILPTDPSPCSPGQSWWNTTDQLFKSCELGSVVQIHATRQWVLDQGYSTGGGIPSGLITISLAACPTGFTEVSALDGKFLKGTLAAHGDVGTTGGNATITPTGSIQQATFTGNTNTTTAVSGGTPSGTNSTVSFTPAGTNTAITAGTPSGTNSTVSFTPAGTNGTGTVTPLGTIAWPAGVPTAVLSWPASVPTFAGSALGTHTHTFTGNALGTHAHELPFQISTTTQIRQIASGTFGTGTSRAATAQQTTTANTTSAAVALTQAVSAGTPAGTNSSISAGTPAGTISWPASVPTAVLSWPVGVPTLTGSSSVTSAEIFTGSSGTVPAETFNGSALPTHNHTFTGSLGTIPAETFTGNALGTHTHDVVPTGNINSQTFTGNAVDPSPSYVKVIFCSKN